MLIRTYADIEKLEGKDALIDAEWALIENCKLGEPTVLGDGKLPDGPNSERNIRAGLLRYLILGGCERCQMREQGVRLSGAQIVGKVDISFARTVGGVVLNHCAFDMPIAASQAHLDRLELSGCRLLGMNAESIMVRGDMCFDQVRCDGILSISGGEIGGQLVVVGAELNGSEGQAFIAQGVLVRGGVFLENLKSIGEVSFAGAEIGVQFSAEEAEFNGGDELSLNAQSATIKGGTFLKHVKSTGEISFMGAEIDFQLSFEGADLNGGKGRAFNGQGMVVAGGLFWRDLSAVVGLIHLNTAQLGDLVDDKESWGKVSLLSLIGLTYGNLISPMDLTFRKRWLKLGSTYKGQFYPQPYQQLAKFYRETGHRYEAREILVAKEIEQRKATRKAIREGKVRTESWLHPKVLSALNFLWDWTTRLIAGYGYKPWLSL
jgi:hypothetical protein